jgi:hypothetical protein
LPAIKNGKQIENSALEKSLKQKLSVLALPLPVQGKVPAIASQITGKTYTFEPNNKNIKSVKFLFKDNICHVTFMIDSAYSDFSFGSGRWVDGTTTIPGPNLLLQARAHFVGLPPSKVTGSYGWEDENTLDLVLRYIESPHTERISCVFNKNEVLVDFRYSNLGNNSQLELKGVLTP